LAFIRDSLEQLKNAKPEDTVLFYFSGHGFLDANNRPILAVADTSVKFLESTKEIKFKVPSGNSRPVLGDGMKARAGPVGLQF
jgi:hypothetical protein